MQADVRCLAKSATRSVSYGIFSSENSYPCTVTLLLLKQEGRTCRSGSPLFIPIPDRFYQFFSFNSGFGIFLFLQMLLQLTVPMYTSDRILCPLRDICGVVADALVVFGDHEDVQDLFLGGLAV